MTFDRSALRAALMTSLLLPLFSLSRAADFPSPALAQLQAINDGGPAAFRVAADDCPPAPGAKVTRKPGRPSGPSTVSRTRAAVTHDRAGIIDRDQASAAALAGNRNVNNINITVAGTPGGAIERGEEHHHSLPFLGAGVGGVVGYGLMIALGCSLGPIGIVGIVALCALAGAGAQMAMER